MSNSFVGNYAYPDLSVSAAYNMPTDYKTKEIELNNQGDLYYQQHKLQKVTYNAFKKPVEVSEEGKGKVSFSYGSLMNRTKAFYGGDEANKEDRLYHKQYSSITPVEIITNTETNETKIITYIGGDAYTAPIVHIKQSGGTNNINEYHYLHRDYLGSIMGITDASGDIVEQRHYSAWGEVAHFKDSQNNTTFSHSSLINRGYTGHEHFFEVGLIHMNGRMYDPHLGRFLSPDNYVQDPYNTQNFNRYGYVLNNPLKYNDPSGEFAWAPILIGGAINWAVNGAKFNGEGLAAFTIGAMAGQAGGLAGSGIASAVGTVGFTSGALIGAGAGFTGGAIGGAGNAWLGGASFNQGLSTGPKEGIIGGVTGGLIGGISGGIQAVNQNRDFWSGKKWITTGYNDVSLSGFRETFTNWDYQSEMDISHTPQKGNWDCTWACKKSVDKYFGVAGQEGNNSIWYNLVKGDGLNSNFIPGYYKAAGYNIDLLGNGYLDTYLAKNALPWMLNKMNSNQVIQLGWYPNGSNLPGHASLVNKIQYLSDFSKYRVHIMNPSSGGQSVLRNFKSIYQIFSIYR